jgi:hypothetical protein
MSSGVRINACWLVYFHVFKSFFRMGITFLSYTFLFTPLVEKGHGMFSLLMTVWIYRIIHRRMIVLSPPSVRATAPSGPGPPHYRCFTIILRHTTLSRTPLDEWSVRRRDFYLTTQTLTRDKHPCPRWNSNPRSQQALGRRTTP